ncbi:hypothetical protein ASG22_15260 [Chryseobacterium sp. Leaf405]|uniref:hypothetical protein n=1 Tax=Chryseobacterium sp. Leaf405 TaxID=1736367 RepID=UPI0006F2A08D|nr:hypothetical protein [Chryseobacterium sp. Leaf405]KQT21512.1 hypothetical protein ASG22_15260 [Chryseobacterium sp. Leaf405]
MEPTNKSGQIRVFTKNIIGKAKEEILEESKQTKNNAGLRHIQNGKTNGVNHGANHVRKISLELRVLKVEGPFDEKNKKVQIIEKDKWYTYKATKFNREPTKNELQNLRWGIKYDDDKIKELKEVSCKGYRDITHKVLDNNSASKLTIYSFFKAPNQDVNTWANLKKCTCNCLNPKENFPYTENTFNKIKEIATLINYYSSKYSVPAVAIAGSIADEYNIINESDSGKFINWLQDDIVINFMPNFAIEFDVYIGGTSKLNNATKHDLGIGNIKLETAKKLYDQYKTEFKRNDLNYKDIVSYIQSNEGTVHLATLVIRKAQGLFEKYVSEYCNCKKEAVYVTYYKQGDLYLKKFLAAKKNNPKHKILPGEGCRVSLQREKIINSLT